MASFGELVLVLGDMHVPSRASKIPAAFQRMLVPNKMQHCICTGNVDIEQYEMLRSLVPNLVVVAGDYDNNDDNIASSGMPTFPETAVVQVGEFRIGVIHGHQILPWNSSHAYSKMRRKLKVDVLVTGHTHNNEAKLSDDETYFHINPGSITGAYSPMASIVSADEAAVSDETKEEGGGTTTGDDADEANKDDDKGSTKTNLGLKDVKPSFILLAVQESKIVCYVYELTDEGGVDVSKTEFNKLQLKRASGSGSNNPALMQSLLS